MEGGEKGKGRDEGKSVNKHTLCSPIHTLDGHLFLSSHFRYLMTSHSLDNCENVVVLLLYNTQVPTHGLVCTN